MVPLADAPGPVGKRVFLSFAASDREPVARVVTALRKLGVEVFWEHNPTPGTNFGALVSQALDAADAVVVFWSRASVNSEWVLSEASEGLRRGLLLPVLLDETRPPLLFRSIQSADLSRDFDRALPGLLADVMRVALGVTGDRTQIVARPPPVPVPVPPPRSSAAHAPVARAESPAGSTAVLASERRALLRGPAGVVTITLALLLLGGWLWLIGTGQKSPVTASTLPQVSLPPDSAPPVAVQPPPRIATVPNFIDRKTDVALEIARSINLKLVGTDENGAPLAQLPDGLVLSQRPAAGTPVREGSDVWLSVATAVRAVPSVAGLSLSDALARLRASELALGPVESVEGSGARVGTVIQQSPSAGKSVPLGTQVKVGVAAATRPAPKSKAK